MVFMGTCQRHASTSRPTRSHGLMEACDAIEAARVMTMVADTSSGVERQRLARAANTVARVAVAVVRASYTAG